MKACADRRPLRLLWLTSALLLAACGSAPKRDTPPDPPSAEQAAPVPDKGDPEGRFQAALQLMKQRKTAEAEAAFLALSQDFPDFSGPLTNIGILNALADKPQVALTAFTRAAETNPDNVSAFNWLGILHRQAGDARRARQAYERALAVKPDYASAHFNLGLLCDEVTNEADCALRHYGEYQRLTAGKDLRVLVWIAELEAEQREQRAREPAEVEVK
ncbi:MAG TPA: tetratricopeptide repeat protein [Nevskiaceae bacterium]|nr:tetratricopeptide repeat protein [Nevskiaceae bacterium]